MQKAFITQLDAAEVSGCSRSEWMQPNTRVAFEQLKTTGTVTT